MKKLIKKALTEKQISKLRFIKYYFIAISKGIQIKKINSEKYIVSKNNYKFETHKKYLSYYITCFEEFKKYNIQKINDNLIKINFKNFKLITDIESVMEIPRAIEKYNLYYKLKPKDVIFDLGAYHGLYSFYAVSLQNNAIVYAFEPDEKNFKILKQNIINNNLKNIIPINKAIYNKNGKINFTEQGMGSMIDDSGKIEIETTTIKSIMNKYKIKKINFIKMDVEGAELEIVDDFFKNKLPNTNFAIASYHIVNNEKTHIKLEQIFKKNKYKVITANKELHLTTYASKK